MEKLNSLGQNMGKLSPPGRSSSHTNISMKNAGVFPPVSRQAMSHQSSTSDTTVEKFSGLRLRCVLFILTLVMIPTASSCVNTGIIVLFRKYSLALLLCCHHAPWISVCLSHFCRIGSLVCPQWKLNTKWPIAKWFAFHSCLIDCPRKVWRTVIGWHLLYWSIKLHHRARIT